MIHYGWQERALEDRLERTEKERDEAQREQGRLQDELDDLAAQCEETEERAQRLALDHEGLENANRELRAEVKRLREELWALQSQMRRRGGW